MKKAHAEGRHPGWAHINLDLNRLSYPEKFVLKVLQENKIKEKYTIIQHHPVGKYFLDFAIMELKLDIEVDGEQHFRTQSAINHDKIRDDFLRLNDWTIYRISWGNMVNNSIKEIKELIEFINVYEKGLDRYYEWVLKEKIIAEPKGVKTKRNNDLKWKPFIQKVIQSNIDFSKRGWIRQMSIILKIKPQKVNGWMKRNLPGYLEKCYKNYKRKLGP